MKNYINLTNEKLIAEAVSNKEGIIAANGAFSTTTGKRTGRSPNDRYIVKEPSTESSIDWGNINKPFAIDDFEKLWNKVEALPPYRYKNRDCMALSLFKIDFCCAE